jgi:hypothetical protein
MAGGTALRTVGKAASDRIRGDRPGPFRAFAAAAVVGVVSAVATYRLLRSGD